MHAARLDAEASIARSQRSRWGTCRTRRTLLDGLLEAGDLGDEAALVLDLRVPVLEAVVELGELVAAPLEPYGLAGGIGAHAVLVPGQLPGNGHRELAGRARERDDARVRLADALRDAADGAPVG